MVRKKEFIWNTAASMVTSLFSVFLLFICARVNGSEIAGLFSITYAISLTMNAIGDYGIRIYQVTDIKRKYKFGEYLTMRWIVVLAMIIITTIYMFVAGFNFEKLIMCLLLVLYRAVENISEAYQGELQINGKLDTAGKSIVYRNCIAMAIFTIVDIFTKNLLLSTIIMVITNAILLVLYDMRIIEKYQKNKLIINLKNQFKMLKDCFPVCLSSILNVYISNAPKYAIDKGGSYDMQTIFSIIYLPTFTINLASLFILKPMMNSMAKIWNSKKIKDFFMLLFKMFGYIIGVTAFIELICATIGLPILKFIYGINVLPYVKEVLILVLSGGFFALTVVLFYALTTMRKQKIVMFAYGLGAMLAYLITTTAVIRYEILGAAIATLVVNIFMFIFLMLSIIIVTKKNNKSNVEVKKLNEEK